jgi:cyclophilin family peptidyl-prolyl cis-trans isomerase
METRVFLATCDLWVLGALEDELPAEVFGKVVEGYEVVQKIEAVGSGWWAIGRKILGCFSEMEYQRMSRHGEWA